MIQRCTGLALVLLATVAVFLIAMPPYSLGVPVVDAPPVQGLPTHVHRVRLR